MEHKDRVKIAIAGRTNTGKTTLISTLMRSPSGEINDSPNVTKKGTAYSYDSLQATFIDTPGFQHASAVSLYIDLKKNNPDVKMSNDWKDKITFDMEAIESLEKSDIVLYVGSLSYVPDDSYKEEINLVRKIQPKVVGILNQRRKQVEASSEEMTENRIAQWEKVFKEQGIESVVIFDAHWDKPSAINQIYESVNKTLTPELQELFKEGLIKFKKRQAEIREQACNILAQCIESCQEQSNISVKKGNFSESEAKQKIAEELYAANLVFLTRVSKLYEIAAEHPTESKDELNIRLENSVDYGARLGIAVSMSTVFGGGSAAVGGAIGALLAGAFSGGLGAGAGAALGAQIGGGIGALMGTLGLFVDSDDNVEVGVVSEDIREIVAAHLAAIWGLSNVGFGRGRDLTQKEIEEIKNKILKSDHLPPHVDWTTVPNPQVINYCKKSLDALEAE